MAVLVLAPKRLIKNADLKCPAADTADCGKGVHCRIERHTLPADTEARSIARWCLGNYETCPTWRAERDAIWAKRQKEFDAEIEEGTKGAVG